MSNLADILQVLSSSLPTLLIGTVLMFVSYVGRGFVDGQAVKRQRAQAVAQAAAEAAAEATAAVKTANIADQAAFRQELLARVGELEEKLDKSARDCEERRAQDAADHAAALAKEAADHAEARAREYTRHTEQLAAIRGEHAKCLADVADLRADLGAWRVQAEHFADVAAQAMLILKGNGSTAAEA